MLDRFIDIAQKFFSSNDKILLAVSGGVDSMVMLKLFTLTNYNIGVAHCNFALRGKDSDEDMALVERFCSDNEVKFHTVIFDTYKEMSMSGESLQMTARKLRYDWFDTISKSEGYNKIAIAHNSGDTIETLFINLIRGTGVRGLIGIPTTRENIVRPIMNFTRDEIEQYARRNGVEWREDISNSGVKYMRNKLRHNVIPVFKDIDANFEKTMLANIERIEDANIFIQKQIEEIARKAISTYRGRITVSLTILSNYSPLSFTMYEIFSPLGFNSSVIRDMESCYLSGGRGDFFGIRYRARIGRGLAILTPNSNVKESKEVVIKDLNNTNGLSFEVMPKEAIDKFDTSSFIAYFDAQKVNLPFTLRFWMEGDYFVPFGMKGKKKLSDFFIDNKIDIDEKYSTPILVDSGGDILWVVGKRSDNRYRVSNTTKEVLIVRYEE